MLEEVSSATVLAAIHMLSESVVILYQDVACKFIWYTYSHPSIVSPKLEQNDRNSMSNLTSCVKSGFKYCCGDVYLYIH